MRAKQTNGSEKAEKEFQRDFEWLDNMIIRKKDN